MGSTLVQSMISWVPIAIFIKSIGKNSEIHGFRGTHGTRSNLAPVECTNFCS